MRAEVRKRARSCKECVSKSINSNWRRDIKYCKEFEVLERNGKGYMGTKKIQNEKDDARYKKEVEIKELMVEEGRDRENYNERTVRNA